MYENLTKLQTDALAELAAATDAEALEAWRVKYLSRKGGALGEAVKTLSTLPREERPAYGQAANDVKAVVEAAFAARQEALKAAALEAELTGGAHRCDAAGPRAVVGPSAHHHAGPAPALRDLCRDGLPGLRRARCGDR